MKGNAQAITTNHNKSEVVDCSHHHACQTSICYTSSPAILVKCRALVLSEFASSCAAQSRNQSDLPQAIQGLDARLLSLLTVVNPAILFLSLLDWMTATSSATLLLV